MKITFNIHKLRDYSNIVRLGKKKVHPVQAISHIFSDVCRYIALSHEKYADVKKDGNALQY